MKGTNQGTVTDFDGNFLIEANLSPTTYTLIYSYVGYSTVEESVDFSNTSNVTRAVILQTDLMRLDEDDFLQAGDAGQPFRPVNVNRQF